MAAAPPSAETTAYQTGCRDSLGQLYHHHQPWLQQLLSRRLGCGESAADLAQDAFVRLLQAPRNLDSFDGARAYLSRMAKGLCVDHWRRQDIEKAWQDALAARAEAPLPSVEHQQIVIETLCEIDRMLARLPEKVATAFLASQLQGKPYRQIAEELGVSERMVKKYMAQAMLQCALIEAGFEASL
ncbi:RNA polymerase sigma-70 factor, ECF subfamily [Vreelandella subterranea]|uniref:RNA polymerase sigma-70 factor, ECF subfamily n=1 Tax=Vreelandella subterranea TaxID=416874 RepID=A0A1H9T4A3_9GAMM|nr:sigma-70 family RNA polymerase sigma factor [Halomonas subterranea]SER91988.1 RNA polymerase sigma-70 factor, ECF subfamily [Halomonas subterranea]